MKTVGELIREKRLKLEYSIADIAKDIKIKKEYLKYIEKNDFNKLPSITAAKGFIRKYAEYLSINPETALAMFRRDFDTDKNGEIVPKSLVKPILKPARRLSIQFIVITIAVTSFLGFLGIQLYGYYSLPKLDLVQPINNEIYGTRITIKGKTNPNNTVTINGQSTVVAENGEFSMDLVFAPGNHSVIVQVKNRQGKTKMVHRNFQVIK